MMSHGGEYSSEVFGEKENDIYCKYVLANIGGIMTLFSSATQKARETAIAFQSRCTYYLLQQVYAFNIWVYRT